MESFGLNLAQYQILVVEDTLEYKQLISKALGRSDRHSYVSTLDEARRIVNKNDFDCVLLDLSLPDGSGFDFLKEIGASGVPVIILTSSKEIGNKVMGLGMGAQDYISKPFDELELAARVQNKIELWKKQHDLATLKKIGNLQVDMGRRKVTVNDLTDIELTRREFDCLLYFSENQEIVLTREALLDKVWGTGNFVTERSVDSTIVGLRKKLVDWTYELKSIYGVGYQLSLKVKPEVASGHDAEILNIFESESERQLLELEEFIYLGEWSEVIRMIHLLKGTFSIFTADLTELGDTIEDPKTATERLADLSRKFLAEARTQRNKILKVDKTAA